MTAPTAFSVPALPASPASPDPLRALSSNDRELIMELVANISPAAQVLARYNLTAQQFSAKCKDPQFLAAFRETKRLWSSDLNARERIRAKAEFLLEDMVVDMVNAARGEGVTAGQKRDTVETLAKLTDNWEPARHKKEGSAAQNVKININIGGERNEKVVVEGTAEMQEWSPNE